LDTKQRIIRTALKLFLRKGYDRASMQEIARGAGVTKGGVYHHFESKEHLFREALDFATAQMSSWSSSQFGDVRSASSLLAALFGSIASMKDAFADVVGERSGRQRYSFLEILVNAARRDEGVREKMGDIYARSRANMREVLLRAQQAQEIRGDIDCDVLAFEIAALIEGVLLLSIIDRTVDLEAAGDRLYANMWKMIRR